MTLISSRRGTLRRHGLVWTSDGDTWETVVDDRFHVITWKFGSIHQSKIIVKYDATKKQKRFSEGDVGICCDAQQTREEAMKRGLDWVEEFKTSPKMSPNEAFAKAFKNWGGMYPTRMSWRDHVFFTIGNGYDWLDGVIIGNSPDDDKAGDRFREEAKKRHVEYVAHAESLREAYKLLGKEDKVQEMIDELMSIDPPDPTSVQPDPSGPQSFYPVSENYSNICCVPDDVREDWLLEAYKSAIMLRDLSGIDPNQSTSSKDPNYFAKQAIANKTIGAKICAELEERFGQKFPRVFRPLDDNDESEC